MTLINLLISGLKNGKGGECIVKTYSNSSCPPEGVAETTYRSDYPGVLGKLIHGIDKDLSDY